MHRGLCAFAFYMQGKLEKSLLTFATTYATWQPDESACQMLRHLTVNAPPLAPAVAARQAFSYGAAATMHAQMHAQAQMQMQMQIPGRSCTPLPRGAVPGAWMLSHPSPFMHTAATMDKYKEADMPGRGMGCAIAASNGMALNGHAGDASMSCAEHGELMHAEPIAAGDPSH